MSNSKYTTLVFKTDTPDSLDIVRGFAMNDLCMAWSLDHEIMRLELIEKALEAGDIKKALSYIGHVDVTEFLHELTEG